MSRFERISVWLAIAALAVSALGMAISNSYFFQSPDEIFVKRNKESATSFLTVAGITVVWKFDVYNNSSKDQIISEIEWDFKFGESSQFMPPTIDGLSSWDEYISIESGMYRTVQLVTFHRFCADFEENYRLEMLSRGLLSEDLRALMYIGGDAIEEIDEISEILNAALKRGSYADCRGKYSILPDLIFREVAGEECRYKYRNFPITCMNLMVRTLDGIYAESDYLQAGFVPNICSHPEIFGEECIEIGIRAVTQSDGSAEQLDE